MSTKISLKNEREKRDISHTNQNRHFRGEYLFITTNITRFCLGWESGLSNQNLDIHKEIMNAEIK